MRFILALRCFFLVLFARRLPADALKLLPPPVPPTTTPDAEVKRPPRQGKSGKPEKEKQREKERDEVHRVDPQRAVDHNGDAERGALGLLALLQREGRLIDFLEEKIDTYSDAQVGAAVRDIHRGCRKALDEHMTLEPVLPQADNSAVRVEEGFDPGRIRLVGQVVGQPPWNGLLRHPGWRAETIRLPTTSERHDPRVIAPAEVELG